MSKLIAERVMIAISGFGTGMTFVILHAMVKFPGNIVIEQPSRLRISILAVCFVGMIVCTLGLCVAIAVRERLGNGQ